ncbi:hypothetical protein Pcinc_025725 [Petrolisthes cinctipes]|uniref:Globin domain-containing protein n=1 Tax=Petrolisthes cinctipes TaxID=88211 RepID=A0AAE1F882_PETCI|nr:hypothetical protein Pcinc_025725 [Petrolisthes cinctipes]
MERKIRWEKAVRRLDQPDKLERLIRECGRNHCYYGAHPHQVQLVVPQFLQAVQPTLGDEWTGDVESAWSTLLHNVNYIMREAMFGGGEEVEEGRKGWMDGREVDLGK